MLNSTQKEALDDCLEQLTQFCAHREDWRELYQYLVEVDPESRGLCQKFQALSERQELPVLLRNVLLNIRKLILGKEIVLHYFSEHGCRVEIQDVIPFRLGECGPGMAEDIADYTKTAIQNMLNIIPVDLENAIDNADVAAHEGEKSSEVPEDLIAWFLNGIGRGTYNFVRKPIDVVLHPIQTIHGFGQFLYVLATDPVELVSHIKQELKDYASTDPIAFTTEVIYNIFLLGLPYYAAKPAPSALPPSLPVEGLAPGITGGISRNMGGTIPKTSAGIGQHRLFSTLRPSIPPTIASSSVPAAAISKGLTTIEAVSLSSTIGIEEKQSSKVINVALKQARVKFIIENLNNFSSEEKEKRHQRKLRINLAEESPIVYAEGVIPSLSRGSINCFADPEIVFDDASKKEAQYFKRFGALADRSPPSSPVLTQNDIEVRKKNAIF